MNALKQPQQSDTRRIAIHKSNISSTNTKSYIAKQRACGAVLLIVSILSAVIAQDSTAAVYLTNGMMNVNIDLLHNGDWQLFDEFDVYEFSM